MKTTAAILSAILGEAIDYSRQAQIKANELHSGTAATTPPDASLQVMVSAETRRGFP